MSEENQVGGGTNISQDSTSHPNQNWGPSIGGATQEQPGLYVGKNSFSVFTKNNSNTPSGSGR